MLMQNFKSAADLGITEPQLSALQKTLVLLETGRLVHADFDGRSSDGYREEGEFTGHFNMGRWRAAQDCGTVCCIAGTAELIGDVEFSTASGGALGDLFWAGDCSPKEILNITPAQAATALRSYLTTGDARWDLAVA
jgi:hypothetical protein